jgi:dimethylaniline monooxygenase (N-oxide forming)
VTIVGGHKSNLEGLGTTAQAGKKVEWLVRAEGGGPTRSIPAKNPDGSSMAKMSTKRVMALVSRSVYNSKGSLIDFYTVDTGSWGFGWRHDLVVHDEDYTRG